MSCEICFLTRDLKVTTSENLELLPPWTLHLRHALEPQMLALMTAVPFAATVVPCLPGNKTPCEQVPTELAAFLKKLSERRTTL